MDFVNEGLQVQGKNIDFQKIRTALMRYCLALTGSRWDAEDLAQEVCLKALPLIKGTRGHANPEAYLLQIAKHAWIDKLRKNQQWAKWITGQNSVESPLDGQNSVEQVQDTTSLDVELALKVLITHLSPLQRTVFLLRDVFGFTSLNAAEVLKTTDGAVKAALYRARSCLFAIKDLTKAEVTKAEVGEAKIINLVHNYDKELLEAYTFAIRDGDSQLLVQLMQNDHVDAVMAASIAINQSNQSRRVISEANHDVRLAA